MTKSEDNDLSGRKVGEYDVKGRIGVGGMGVVYEGLQPMIGKRVAIKALLPHLSRDPELVQRFLSEARAVNAIGHRGIVDIFSFAELPEGGHYFVMEFLEGTSFDKLLKDRGALKPYDVLIWMSEVLDALHAAHQAGIIHRDIKPSNLFLVHSARVTPYVKLLDFGIAKLGALVGDQTPQTRASMLIGTPDYMSPEQARGRAIGPWTDLYALGCVMFELITGDRLFRGENPMQTMFMHVENVPRRMSEVVPGITTELDDLVAWMLEKDPANRPQSAAALRNAVERLLDAIPPDAPSFEPTVVRVPSKGTPPPISGNRVRRSRAATPPPPTSTGRATLGAPITEDRTAIQVAPTRVAPKTSVDVPVPSAPLSTAAELEAVPGLRRSRGPLIGGLVALAVLGVGVGVYSAQGDAPPKPAVVLEPPRAEPEAKQHALIVVDPKPDPRVDEPKAAEPQAAEPQAAEPKAAEPKAAEPKAVEASAAEAKAAEAKAAEAKPAEAKAVEAKPAEPKRVEPKRVEPKPAEPKPEPKSVEVKREPKEPKPERVKPASKVPTEEELTAKLSKLEATVKDRDAKRGTRDAVLNQFLDQSRKVVGNAKDEAGRQKAAKFLSEFERQLAASK